MKNFKLGLCSVSFKDISPEKILKTMTDDGLNYVEWASNCHAPCDDLEKLKQIAELQNKYGVKCSSYGTYFRLGENDTNELYHYIKAAKLLGTNVLRLWAGTKKSSEYTAEEKMQFFAKCRMAADIAEKENVIFCMEFHKNTFTDCGKSSLELMQSVNSPNFRMYWQPIGILSDFEKSHSIDLLSDYIVNVHVFYSENCVQKNLSLGFDAWCSYLKKIKNTAVLLFEFMPDGRLETLASEVTELKNIIAGMEE